MRKYIKILFIILISVLTIIAISGCTKIEENDGKIKIVTSFYPIYIMSQNIIDGAKNVELSNMTDSYVGCIHDYTLKPADLKKIEKADIFIENGLGIENFNDKLINSNSNLEIINSGANINGLVDDNELNGHTWTSLSNYIVQIEEITNKLKEKNSANSEIYQKNADEYKKKIFDIKKKYDDELSGLKYKKAVVLNESYAYLLNDLKIETLEIHTDHEESTISAEKLKEIIEEMKEKNINIIIIDKDDNEKNAETLRKETGAEIYKLNSCLNGSLDKDSYINAMNENLEVFKEMLK